MRKKLDAHEYPNAQAFFGDFQAHDLRLFPLQPRRYAREPDRYRTITTIRRQVEEPPTTQAPQPSYDDDMGAEDGDSEDDNQQCNNLSFASCFLMLTDVCL